MIRINAGYEGSFQRVLRIQRQIEIVSSDIVGMRYGSLFDATQTMALPRLTMVLYEVQVVSWYDNENSYTSQMVRTIKYFCRT